MTQYVNEYGTLFAVREHNGAPALMCKSKAMNKWSLSAALAAVKGDACTTEDLQEVLDEYARAHGWPPINGFPSWAENIVANFVSRQWVQNLSDGFSAKGFKGSYEVKCREGSSCGDGFVDTGPQGITIWKGNSHRVKYTWADFVRRCKQTGFAPELKPDSEREEKDLMRDIYFFESEDLNDSHLYSYYDGRFWAFDNEERAWCESSVIREAFETAQNKSPLLKICEFIEDGFISYDETDVPDWAVKDLKEIAKRPTAAVPASPADAGAAEQSLPAAGPASLAAKDTNVPTFDYSGLDNQTVEDLHLAEREYMRGRKLAEVGLRRMADGVAMAHDALCSCDNLSQLKHGNRGEASFGAWCDSVGLNRKAAERLLQVAKLFDSSTPREEKVLEELGPSLLYAAAKPSAPAELVQAVKDGDITTHKQYQDLLAKLKAEQTAREEAERALATEKQSGAGTSALLADEQQRRQQANEARIAAENRAASAESRARAAENRAAGAQKLAEQRGTENTELKAKIRELENQPRDVAVVQPGEEQIEAWRREGADRMAATLQDTVRQANQEKLQAQNQVADLQEQLATARPDADACQRTVDTLYETAENLRMLLRSQLKQAQLSPSTYGQVVAHVLLIARALMDTVRVCSPDGYDMDSEEDDDFA